MTDTTGLFSSVGIPAEATDIARTQNGTLAVVVLFSNIKPVKTQTERFLFDMNICDSRELTWLRSPAA